MPHSPENLLQPVSTAEAGQKLLQFLERRLGLPQAMLHRWIRTGQIRCNGKRCKPFQLVAQADAIRLPPFALNLAQQENSTLLPSAATKLLPMPPLAYESDDLFVFNKTAGLPVHPGTGHSDSLTTRLHQHHADAPFCPTPAHRLDKDTSGLLLVARSYARLRELQEAFSQRELVKEYLAWVEGQWPLTTTQNPPQLLRDTLAKRYSGPHEKVEVCPAAPENILARSGHEAACLVQCLRQQGQHSLMHIRLLTGKTHQIRVQLASRGHPLCGDAKYGSTMRPPFKLHAMRLILPDKHNGPDGSVFAVLPPWQGYWQVAELPPPIAFFDLASFDQRQLSNLTALKI